MYKKARYFGTAGVRGKVDVLTPELTIKLVFSFAKLQGKKTKAKRFMVARDCRLTGLVYESAVKTGLFSAGYDIVDLGLTSTPTAEFAIHNENKENENIAGLIIVTASHNPKEYNGLKFVDHKGIMLSKDRGVEVEKNIESPSILYPQKERRMINKDYRFEHAKKIMKTLKHNDKKIKVSFDYANCAPSTMSFLFSKFTEPTSVNAEIDGSFPVRKPEPREEYLKEFLNLVKDNSELGIAFDGDGDRTILITKNGFVHGDVVFALSVIRAFETKKGAIVTTVATSQLIKDIAEEYGQKVIETKVGGPYMIEALLKNKARMAGEEVGAVTWPEISLSKDGFMTASQIIDMHKEKDILERIDGLPKYCNIKKKIEVREKEKIMKILEKEIEDYIGIDGIKIQKKNEWVLIRASGTEELIRVYAEAKTKQRAEELAEKYIKRIKKLDKE